MRRRQSLVHMSFTPKAQAHYFSGLNGHFRVPIFDSVFTFSMFSKYYTSREVVYQVKSVRRKFTRRLPASGGKAGQKTEE